MERAEQGGIELVARLKLQRDFKRVNKREGEEVEVGKQNCNEMAFFLQLQLLLWKNLTLRKRHWGRLLIEIIWPLFLFVILFLVRLRGLKKFHHECKCSNLPFPMICIY